MHRNLTRRAASLALAAVALISLAVPSLFNSSSALSPSAKAYSIADSAGIGAQICSKGGTVGIIVEAVQTDVKADIIFTRDITSREQTLIGSNTQNSDFKLDTVEEELIFGIRTEKGTFFTGPGSRNPDGLPHAKVEFITEDKAVTAVVSFEAKFSYTEALFNDARFKVRGNLAECMRAIRVAVDIKPTSCPNPLSISKNGVIPVAIVGTAKSDPTPTLAGESFDGFDVTTVDPASVRLAGVAPIRSSLEDVATPYQLSDKLDRLDCTTNGADGVVDLTLKFDSREVVASIEKFLQRPLKDGEVLKLPLTGTLSKQFGSVSIKGEDVVWVVR